MKTGSAQDTCYWYIGENTFAKKILKESGTWAGGGNYSGGDVRCVFFRNGLEPQPVE